MIRKILLIITVSSLICLAQNSYYSHYGFGDGASTGSVRFAGLGNTGSSVRDSIGLNFSNPALWNRFSSASLQGAFNSSFFSASEIDEDNILANLNGFSIKFPVGEYIGIGVGVIPKTRMNLIQTFTDTLDGTDIPYNVDRSLKGGISDFFVGGGYQLNSKISLGIKMNFNFGNITYIETNNFQTGTTNYFKRQFKMIGSQLGLGIIWTDKKKLTVSGYYEQNLSFKTSSDYEAVKYIGIGVLDAFEYSSKAASIPYPSTIRLGISNRFFNNLVFNADFQYSFADESLFKEFYIIEQGETTNPYSFGIGFEKLPSNKNKAKFYEKVYYRLGAYNKTRAYYIDSEKIKESGVTLGLGIPFNNNFSRIDMALIFAKRDGFLNEKIGSEDVVSLQLGITTGGLWFKQYKRY